MSDLVERLRDHDRHVRGRLIEGLPDLCIDDMVEAADEIDRLREALRRVAFNAFKREMVLGEARDKFIAIMEANNNAALWQCLEFIGKIAIDALGEGK